MNNADATSAFAEVIESSLISFTAQCWQWDCMPSFGACVKVESKNMNLYSIVYQIQTGSTDAVRKPTPFGKTLEQLRQEQPQIFEFLKTTFACVPIAYTKKNGLSFGVAPELPKIHEFVSLATKQEVEVLFKQDDFVSVLFGLQQQFFNIDELLLATITHAHAMVQFNQQHMLSYLEIYSLLIGNDYRRVKLFARRLESVFAG